MGEESEAKRLGDFPKTTYLYCSPGLEMLSPPYPAHVLRPV